MYYFSKILVLVVFITGMIWLFDKLFFAAKRLERGLKEPVIVEYSKSFFPALFAVLFIRSFIVEPFRIPSSSMVPTLHVGDFLLVNKFAYGLRLPILHTKIFDVGEPKRGDVVVLRSPVEKIDLIKRVVAIPGDKISYHNDDKTLYINGQAVAQEPRTITKEIAAISMPGAKLRFEHLGKSGHFIMVEPNYLLPSLHFPPEPSVNLIVPKGHYFLMGDNRDDSADSRFIGPIAEKQLIGKAFVIWFSWDWKHSTMGVVWHRIGQMIK